MPRPETTELRDGRIVASRSEYRRLWFMVCHGHECACGCERPADTAHHLIDRSLGGDDVIENLVGLAGDGTQLCHGALTTAQVTHDLRGNKIHPRLVRMGIREYLDSPDGLLKRAYIVTTKSEAWLDEHYPQQCEALFEFAGLQCEREKGHAGGPLGMHMLYSGAWHLTFNDDGKRIEGGSAEDVGV